jgi:hypothetical protein
MYLLIVLIRLLIVVMKIFLQRVCLLLLFIMLFFVSRTPFFSVHSLLSPLFSPSFSLYLSPYLCSSSISPFIPLPYPHLPYLSYLLLFYPPSPLSLLLFYLSSCLLPQSLLFLLALLSLYPLPSSSLPSLSLLPLSSSLSPLSSSPNTLLYLLSIDTYIPNARGEVGGNELAMIIGDGRSKRPSGEGGGVNPEEATCIAEAGIGGRWSGRGISWDIKQSFY